MHYNLLTTVVLLLSGFASSAPTPTPQAGTHLSTLQARSPAPQDPTLSPLPMGDDYGFSYEDYGNSDYYPLMRRTDTTDPEKKKKKTKVTAGGIAGEAVGWKNKKVSEQKAAYNEAKTKQEKKGKKTKDPAAGAGAGDDDSETLPKLADDG
ncbi:hypothetical protein L873DRAFT_1808292 [Choiromyces venosus 120613-1]|uniref:Uncharacterized protein n=1 Tax=Choiromyces venosus 120613-1 TaxID=1336337 RepID=A0A3N4JJB8_9PEZI|nr:hypothetical protein L873DRAFT_1808292 [Choiromyces venosus 120613-1]